MRLMFVACLLFGTIAAPANAQGSAIDMHGRVAVMTAKYSYPTADRTGKHNTTRGYAVEIFVLEKGNWTHPFWHLAR